MASEVDISNLALAHVGDGANVQAINPPDGSVQAQLCQTFYPIARDSLLEMHNWSFMTKRVALAQLPNASSTWAYCYAQPVDLISPIAVLDPTARDDTSLGLPAPSGYWAETPQVAFGVYTPQPYQLEAAADGTDILYTNQANAVLRYTARITDTSKFSPLFVETLSWALAAMLAGPLVKGETGMQYAARCQMVAFGQDGKSGKFGRAQTSDANDKRSTVRERQAVSWINGR